MMSFLTLYPKDWQKHSYIAMNGVYENAVLTALKNHSNLREIVLCVDNDEGGIEAEQQAMAQHHSEISDIRSSP